MKAEIIRTKKETTLALFPESFTEEFALVQFVEKQEEKFKLNNIRIPIKIDTELLMERDM